MSIEAINPATGRLIKSYDEMAPDEVKSIIEESHETFRHWQRTGFAERAGLMIKAAEILRDRTAQYAQLLTDEMGKTKSDAEAEINKCADCCEYYAQNAEEFLSDELIPTDATKSYAGFEPLGVVLAVMPWNFPFWQVFRFAAPALMAGNVGVLKHASNVPGSALAIEEVFRDAGFPAHAFRTLLIGSRQVNGVIEHPMVKAVTLTGSTGAGRAVASKSGEMLKKTVLELGGSDAYVILENADLSEAAATCATSRLINAGQSCIAAKRFVVVESVKDDFLKHFVDQMASHKMGDPNDPNNAIGPQARHDLRDELHQQVTESAKLGAKIVLGGEIPDTPGAYYPPTVLTNVKPGMPAYDDELFGPVAAVITAKDESDAIRIANDSVFGLGAAVFTRDVERGEQIAAHELEAGACFVNTFVRSDPRLPFGGIKESGYGRELSYFGIREFVNIKAVYVK